MTAGIIRKPVNYIPYQTYAYKDGNGIPQEYLPCILKGTVNVTSLNSEIFVKGTGYIVELSMQYCGLRGTSVNRACHSINGRYFFNHIRFKITYILIYLLQTM